MMGKKGGALLAVLWLSAALSAIALAVAVTVRAEISRAETNWEGVRAHFLARGALDRAMLYILWGSTERLPNGRARYHDPEIPFLKLFFPTGEAVVEVIPESSKINVNTADPGEIVRLLSALGVNPDAALEIAAGIVDWRSAREGPSLFDAHYLHHNPSFRARHASLEEIEELLMVRGITPELFYGRYDRTPEGALAPRSGLRDCVTTSGFDLGIDVNSARPEVLLAAGAPPAGVAAIGALRRLGPIREPQLAMVSSLAGPAAGRLRLGGGSIVTLRSTARLNRPDGRLSDLRRTVSALVRYNRQGELHPYTILRWRDHDPAEFLTWDVWSR
jgi:general secretion pathway protein K